LEDSITGKCYELIGSGRNCKAIDLSTQEMWHCQMLKQNEFNNLMEIVARMKSVSNCYTEEGFAERRYLNIFIFLWVGWNVIILIRGEIPYFI